MGANVEWPQANHLAAEGDHRAGVGPMKAGDQMELVVLPAPFGPIRATVSFSLTEKLKS